MLEGEVGVMEMEMEMEGECGFVEREKSGRLCSFLAFTIPRHNFVSEPHLKLTAQRLPRSHPFPSSSLLCLPSTRHLRSSPPLMLFQPRSSRPTSMQAMSHAASPTIITHLMR